MKSKTRYMVEGTWTGYRPEQQRIVHRHYTTNSEEAEKLRAMYSIWFSDNTQLILCVSQLAIRRRTKRAPEIDGYSALIADCLRYGVNSVESLLKRRAEGTIA